MIRFLACILAFPAAAQEVQCLPRADLVAQLRETFGESLTARLLTLDGSTMVEVYTAPGSWTLLVTDDVGTSCMVGAGGAWVIQGVPQGTDG